jgi:hypothetical protein
MGRNRAGYDKKYRLANPLTEEQKRKKLDQARKRYWSNPEKYRERDRNKRGKSGALEM